jgi:hypothetical protein
MQPPTYAAREHTSLGPMSATSAELDDASSSGRGDHARGLGGNHCLEGQCGQQKSLNNLRFDDGSGDAHQRFLTKDGRAFGNRPDFTRETEGFQVVEESVADVRRTQNADEGS